VTASFAPIRTARLTVRELRPDDLPAVFHILSCPITTENVSFGKSTLQEADGWLQRRLAAAAKYGFSMLAMETEADGVIGLCGFLPESTNSLELGYVVHHLHWRQGLASEAVSAIVPNAKAAGKNLWATIRRTNAASIKVCEKAGLQRTEEPVQNRPDLIMFRWEPSPPP